MKKSQNELREGVTYQTSVDFSERSDTSEIPSPVITPTYEKLTDLSNCSFVFFCDIETTGLNKTCDIIQITAIFENDIFYQYIVPSKPIARSASHVTGLEMHRSSLFHNGSPVCAVSLKEALTLFLAWLQDRKPCLLIGHNFQVFDFPRIIRAFTHCHLLDALKDLVFGIVDTLPLFRHLYQEA